jgi:predicted DNA binding CopG/RHH family protein
LRKKLPKLKSNEQAEAFIAAADVTASDLSGMVPMQFEMKPKNKSVNLRLPEQR